MIVLACGFPLRWPGAGKAAEALKAHDAVTIPRAPDIADIDSWRLALLSAVKDGGTVDVVATEYSAGLALEVALAHPDLIRTMLLSQVPLWPDERTARRLRFWTRLFPTFLFGKRGKEIRRGIDEAIDRPYPVDLRPQLGSLRVPIVILTSGREEMNTKASARMAASLIPTARLFKTRQVRRGWYSLVPDEFARTVLGALGRS